MWTYEVTFWSHDTYLVKNISYRLLRHRWRPQYPIRHVVVCLARNTGCTRGLLAMCCPCGASLKNHYSDVIMSTMASQITRLTIVYSTVYSGADKKKHQSSASLAFVWRIPRWAETVSIWWRHHGTVLGDQERKSSQITPAVSRVVFSPRPVHQLIYLCGMSKKLFTYSLGRIMCCFQYQIELICPHVLVIRLT